jgi:hypothetical protein
MPLWAGMRLTWEREGLGCSRFKADLVQEVLAERAAKLDNSFRKHFSFPCQWYGELRAVLTERNK